MTTHFTKPIFGPAKLMLVAVAGMLAVTADAGQPQAITPPVSYVTAADSSSVAVTPVVTNAPVSNPTPKVATVSAPVPAVSVSAPAAAPVVNTHKSNIKPWAKSASQPVAAAPAPVVMAAPAPVVVAAVTPAPQPVVTAPDPAPAPVSAVVVPAAPHVPAPVPVATVELSPVAVPSVQPVVTEEDIVTAAEIKRHSRDKTLYSFRADNLDLKAALAMFARANHLNIVPDNDVSGTVSIDVNDLPLDEMMQALLEAGDCSWREQRGLIRVHNTETRTFAVDYLRLSRNGIGESSATLNSASSGGSSGGSSSSSSGSSGGSTGGSSVQLTADNKTDFWTELTAELGHMLSEQGQKSLAINRTAGIIEITDRPSVLAKVEHYLTATEDSIHRQVDIDCKIYDVTLNNQFQFGIDWSSVAEMYTGSLGFGTATLPIANGASQLSSSALGGISRLPIVGSALSTTAGGNLTSLVFSNFNTAAAVNALKSQGNVEVISKPRIRTLNNQTALIKVGEDLSFFNTTTTYQPGTSAGTTIPVQQITVSSITVGTILSLTPQISGNDWISMDISPVLTSLKDIQTFGSTGGSSGGGSGSSGGSSGATAPDLDTKQASTLVRVRDGNTVVIGGLIQTETDKNDTSVPVLGDIPLLGKLFTGTYRNKVKKELVIFVTPHIIRDWDESVIAPK